MKTILITVLLSISLSSYAKETMPIDLKKVYEVLKAVESNNNSRVIGDGGRAYGIIQIHNICVKDINRIYGTSYTHEDAFNEDCSREMFALYMAAGIKRFIERYNTVPTESQIVRFWNGGIYSGYRRETTLKYLRKYKLIKNKYETIRKTDR